MERRILNTNELARAVAGLSQWSVDGSCIKKRLTFADFASALAYINQVGPLADAADHHPDITFGWGYAEIALTTHDRGGVTDVDIALASALDTLDPQE